MRSVLFVDQPHLQRSLGRALGCLGFEVILPVTLDEARRTLHPTLRAPDLLVMNLRSADGGTLDLLDLIANADLRLSVVLITEATDVATAHQPLYVAGVFVLPTELDSFSRSVHRLFGLKIGAEREADRRPSASGALTAGRLLHSAVRPFWQIIPESIDRMIERTVAANE